MILKPTFPRRFRGGDAICCVKAGLRPGLLPMDTHSPVIQSTPAVSWRQSDWMGRMRRSVVRDGSHPWPPIGLRMPGRGKLPQGRGRLGEAGGRSCLVVASPRIDQKSLAAERRNALTSLSAIRLSCSRSREERVDSISSSNFMPSSLLSSLTRVPAAVGQSSK